MKPHVDFNLMTIHKGTREYTWRGVPCIKCPFDLALYQVIITKCKPDLIIEIGTNRGGSALFLADMQKLCGIKGEVHTIDINDIARSAFEGNGSIRYFNHGFEGYNLKNAAGFERVMVIDDGSHYPWDVSDAFQKFNDLVTPGQYYVIEDGVISHWEWTDFDGGPVGAIERIFEDERYESKFRIDWQMCNFFGHNATFNMNGYLIRL